MEKDLAILAAAAYRAHQESRGTIPEYTFEALPADQQKLWSDVAFAVLVQTAQLAFDNTRKAMEGMIQ